MIKKFAIYVLFVSSAFSYAQEMPVGLGRGLSNAINKTIVDESTQAFFVQFIDSYLNKVDFSSEQWAALQGLIKEGVALLEKKNDEKIVSLQKEYEREVREILSVVFDKNGEININMEECEGFLQEAFAELDKDERFADMKSLQQQEQQFKNRVAMALLGDLKSDDEDAPVVSISVQDQFDQIKNLLNYVIESIDKKIQK